MEQGDYEAFPRLAVVASEAASGDASSRDLFEVFLEARVFSQRPEQPGFMAIGEPPDAVIPVFSSLAELGAFAGETDWFSTTGRDVLDLLPEGYDLVLDAAGDHPLRLNSAAWQASPGLEVVWDEGEGSPGQPGSRGSQSLGENGGGAQRGRPGE